MSVQPSSPRRVVLHVGLPKTGTTHIQATLGRHREVLAARGVSYPRLGPEAMFRGAVEIRGSHEVFGLSAGDVAGRWQRLCDHARGFDGTTVISHEILSGADEDQIARALAPLSGIDVDVVITSRDLGRLLAAYWQERVKLGEPWTFEQLVREQIDPELAGERPEPRAMFWHAYDLAETVRRWAAAVGADHVRVVTAPRVAGEGLWQRFVVAAELSAAAAALPAAPQDDGANQSLGRTQVALLRELDAALGDRLDRRTRALVVKRWFAEQVLPGLGTREVARAPARLRQPFEALTRAWLADLKAGGIAVIGEPTDLDPVCAEAADPHPDDVELTELLALAREALAEVTRRPPPAP